MKTDIDVSFKALYNYMYEIAPIILGTMVLLIIILLISLYPIFRLGVRYADKVWKNNIEYHMDKVYKDELVKRKETIKEQGIVILALEKDNRRLQDIADGMKHLTKFL